MSKRVARHPESYQNEARQFEEAARMVARIGFHEVKTRKVGQVKLIDGISTDGGRVSFWVKQGWAKSKVAAIQFGMFSGPKGKDKPDSEFVEFVRERIDRVTGLGATHALLVHGDTLAIAVPMDKIGEAYAEQMRKFPRVARNTKSPTMFFFDPRPKVDPELTAIVLRLAVPLDTLAGRSDAKPEDPEARSRMAEVEARVSQAMFRSRVGERCGWRCAITGSTIKEALDAAHLPDRDWRTHNQGTDGILLRADIHRLIDKKLAWIVEGRFVLSDEAKKEYGQFEGRAVV